MEVFLRTESNFLKEILYTLVKNTHSLYRHARFELSFVLQTCIRNI